MLKNFSKLLISAIVLLVILSITLGLLQMTTRSRIKRVIEDWEKALCEFRLDQARRGICPIPVIRSNERGSVL